MPAVDVRAFVIKGLDSLVHSVRIPARRTAERSDESGGLYVLLRAQATQNRYRLRWREAVRDPSTALALLASVRMTNMLRRFGQDE